MSYETKNIRNVCLLGHGGSGKTTLAESMLYLTGAIDRQGKTADGNTVCDYDPEEIKRKITISTSIAPVNFGGCKINILDCPGFFDFAGDARCAMRAAEAGMIFCTAKDGIAVGAERCWKYLKSENIPCLFYISKTDEDHGDFAGVLSALQDKYGSAVCAVTAPMSDGTGVIDLVHNVAYQTKGNKTEKIAVPAADADMVESLRETLFEAAAGADEALMEKYFEDMMLSEEDTVKGLRLGLKDRTVFPVLCGAAGSGIGTESVLRAIVDYVPSPADIVAIGKMEWKTGDTVCDPKNEVELPAIKLAEPCYSMAISPKTKGQDDKVASGLARLNEEDISFTLVNNAETHQMVISGAGDIQVDVLCAKLKSRFGVETELKPARVAYREKIKAKVEAHGRHKKQSGGSGQFGDVWIRFEPQDESDDMIFAEEVFGGSVPKNFFPSVEKGLRNAVQKGVLAGYPLVGLKAVLYDGSYHPVDSNDMAFQTAARLAYQDGIPKAKPTILEPIGLLKVTIPDANLGDIMSDISSKRRGTVLGMTAEDGMQTVEAEVPMAEMGSYTIDLRSMTQGRGSFSCKFVRYEEAPGNVQQKVIEEAKKEQEA